MTFANERPVIGRPFDEAMRVLWLEPVAADIIGDFRRTLDTGEPYYSRDLVNPRADIGQTEGYEWELHRLILPDGPAWCATITTPRSYGRPSGSGSRATGGRTSS